MFEPAGACSECSRGGVMARITDVEVGDVRCFEGAQSARTRRITLLVGENGAGKSTFLGCYRTLAKFSNLHDLAEDNHFDEPPLQMGGFDSIARAGKTSFTVGGRFAEHCHDRVAFTFRAVDGQPVDRGMELRFRGASGVLHELDATVPAVPDVVLRLRSAGFSFDLLPGDVSFRSVSTWLSRYVRYGHLPFGGDLNRFRETRGRTDALSDADFLKCVSLLTKDLRFPDAHAVHAEALEPTLPPRQRRHAAAPDHFATGDESDQLAFLGEMGRKLGLWDAVHLDRRLDERGAQVSADTPSGRLNLVDLGCGARSLMAILSFIYRSAPETVLLFQQPEIHVHPRAQAGLAQWMAGSGRSFVIETHSDHFVDRFRICVMKETLAPDELSIVYFEPAADGTRSRMHSISVDSQGNLEGAPDGYRSFFLEETRSLLGF